MVATATLAKVAVYGACGISAFGLFAHYHTENSVRKSLCYKEAMDCLCDHPEAQQQLGKSISGGKIDYKNGVGYDSETEKFWYSLPVTGSKARGNMTYYVNKVEEEDRNYKVSRIELEVDHIKDKILLIKKESV
ncbi:uncharacterized protein LOC122507460 [Leptopilina heterotoma]|uniref:uncharacterized protein LOC122507460 n=1 Tax=Leptopilina heterotoma TaxID=63436 RepID=UPI001CA7BF79|nr:uncharacterized protein LOC122507460 [Leptopilina heterotoma]